MLDLPDDLNPVGSASADGYFVGAASAAAEASGWHGLLATGVTSVQRPANYRSGCATSTQRRSASDSTAASMTACAAAPSRNEGRHGRFSTIASMNSTSWS